MKSGKCPKCGGMAIVEVHPGEYGDGNSEYPMAVTAEPRWVLSSRNPRYPKGELLLYFCQDCGFVEWYVADPKSVPIGPGYRTRPVGTQMKEGRP
jgi:predicted nucleic-acid-binding Zn-ribbon protein